MLTIINGLWALCMAAILSIAWLLIKGGGRRDED